MIVRKTKDGKNGSVQVSGWMPSEVEPALLLDLKDVFTAPREGWKGIRLDAAVWAIQEKAGIYLWWGSETKNEENLILVCESRNFMRFEDGVLSPRMDKGWDGKIYFSTFKVDEPKAFFLILDFDKQ